MGKTTEFVIDKDGLLFKKDKEGEKLVIPKGMIFSVLQNHHDTPFSGHLGIHKTTELLKQRYFWPNMARDTNDYINSCKACALRKPGNKVTAPMGMFEAIRAPMELTSIDIVGKLPITSAGNAYLLTFVDHLSRYVDTMPIKDQKAETVANAFVMNFITRLLSDRGTVFLGKLFKEICKVLGIAKIQTTAFNPACNGKLERSHATLANIVAHYVEEYEGDWDRYLPFALMAMRNTKSAGTGLTPYFLFHGREMNLPTHDDQRFSDQEGSRCQRLTEVMDEAFKLATENTEMAKRKSKEYSDKNKKLAVFNVGDQVYVYHPEVKNAPGHKFAKFYMGPHTIVGKLSELVYGVQLEKRVTNIHVNRLKSVRDNLRDSMIMEYSKLKDILKTMTNERHVLEIVDSDKADEQGIAEMVDQPWPDAMLFAKPRVVRRVTDKAGRGEIIRRPEVVTDDTPDTGNQSCDTGMADSPPHSPFKGWGSPMSDVGSEPEVPDQSDAGSAAKGELNYVDDPHDVDWQPERLIVEAEPPPVTHPYHTHRKAKEQSGQE